MATIFKISGKNVGKDVSILIKDNLGNSWNGAELGIITDFEVSSDLSHQETHSIINEGQIFHESTPQGGKVSIKMSRYSSALEDMESLYRKNHKAGVQVEYTLQYQTKNRQGPVNTKRLTGGKPLNFKLGSYQAKKDVEQGVDFIFADISGGT